MKTQPIKITTQSPKLPGIPATLIAAMLAFSVLPKTWSQSRDLFWTGGVRLTVTPADAGSGTWVLGGAWSNTRTSTGNTIWTDGSVAHFLGSNGGTATLGSFIKAAGINFDSGASAFTIDTNLNTLTIQGAGITNNSGKTQTITNSGGGFDVGHGLTVFINTSTAGSVVIINNGFIAPDGQIGGTQFLNSSTAGSATIINNGGAVAGETQFLNTSTAGSATIINNGGTGGGLGGS